MNSHKHFEQERTAATQDASRIADQLAGELAQAHGVTVEAILRAAVMDFALGRGHGTQAQALRIVAELDAELDAAHGDEKRHSSPTG